MNLKNKIQEDLTQAIKSGDVAQKNALRNVLSKITEAEKSGKTSADENVLKILSSSIKKLKESVEMFRKGSREDLVEASLLEAEILSAYLPAEPSREEILSFYKENYERILSESGNESKARGMTMGLLTKKWPSLEASKVVELLKATNS